MQSRHSEDQEENQLTTEIQLRNDFTVGLVDHMGGDESILRAMLVASDKDSFVLDMDDSGKSGRINALMRERHGSPFEHNAMTFYVEAPIFVFREWHRHRIGISINEQSGRYSELPPMFYVPPPERPMIRVEGTKQMDYVMVPAETGVHHDKVQGDLFVFRTAYKEYERQLAMGIAKEAARNVLPVAIYSKMYWTCNARSLMAFLSLRVRSEDAMFLSKPQWEINQCALIMESAAEECFATLFPRTYDAFVQNGRVAP